MEFHLISRTPVLKTIHYYLGIIQKKISMENQGPCSKLPEERSKGSVSACLDISYQGPLLSVFQTGNSPVEAHDTFSFTG